MRRLTVLRLNRIVAVTCPSPQKKIFVLFHSVDLCTEHCILFFEENWTFKVKAVHNNSSMFLLHCRNLHCRQECTPSLCRPKDKYVSLHYVALKDKYVSLHYIALKDKYVSLHYVALKDKYGSLHYFPLKDKYAPLHYVALKDKYVSLHYVALKTSMHPFTTSS